MAFIGETFSTSDLHPTDESKDGMEFSVCIA